MVFGVIAAGLGVGLAGLGIHGASRRAGRAATLVGDQTAQNLGSDTIRGTKCEKVYSSRKHGLKSIRPSYMLIKVLDRTEELSDYGYILPRKILALLFFVLIFYVSKLALSSVRKNNQTKN